ncbi:hypothetical protein [Salibacter halophilus]|uniref:Uncharacterized protein n=1 Tax=Salibacter halophilus TaxID=1803916 RepID=A0A6N6M594_9FLAO|nr:hypothetical protein [Salibacter halophilus]KAB1061965.1 hypothetical protein F3059_12870 [Salibacter halophilus]
MNLNSQQKYYLLIAGSILLLILIYPLAISKTVAVSSSIDKLEKRKTELASLKSKENELLRMQSRLKDTATIGSDRNSILTYISMKGEKLPGLEVAQIPEVHFYSSDDLNIETNVFVLEGPFKSHLGILDSLYFNGKISPKSVHLYKQRNFKKRKNELYCKLYFQRVKD